MDTDAKLKHILEFLDQLSEDTSIPRNIRRSATNAKELLLKIKDPLDVRAASAVFMLEDIANDPNLPLHGRTLIWNLISSLETLK